MTSSEGADQVLSALIEKAQSASHPYGSLDEWWPLFREERQNWNQPIDQALIGGAMADRIAYAFAAGYQAALHHLDPTLPKDRIASLSITEEGGGHPKAIEATFSRGDGEGVYVLNGKKKWATMSSDGGLVLVAASRGVDDAGRKQLALARLDMNTSGITITEMPRTDFAPELYHCRLLFDDVTVREDQFLPGDGYLEYIKPFRTIEDAHVSAAVMSYLLCIAFRSDWPKPVIEEIIALLLALRLVATSDPKSLVIHLALEGIFRGRDKLLESAGEHWAKVTEEERERWQRDLALTSLAGRVRQLRSEKAWQTIG